MTRSCLEWGEGSRDGAGHPAEHPRHQAGDRGILHPLDGWMDGWMVAPSQMENRLGTSGLVLWPHGLHPMASALLPAPIKSQHPTREGLFSHTVLSVCNATLPTLCPTSTSSLIPILPIPEAEPSSACFRQLPFPEAHHPSRWVPKKIFLSWKIGYSSQSMTSSRPPKAQQRTCVVGREGEGEMN